MSAVKALWERLLHGGFLKSVAVLASGTAGAQLIMLLCMPWVARLYGPEAFGMLGLFMTMVWVAGPIAALAYPSAIVLPADADEANALIRICWRISLFVGAGSALLLLLATIAWPDWALSLGIKHFVYLLPLVILASGGLQILQQSLLRLKLFSLTARVVVVQALIINSLKLILGFSYASATTLIMLAVADILLQSLLLAFIARSALKPLLSGSSAAISFPALVRKYSDFPLFRAPHLVINALSQGIPLMLLTSVVGPAAAGFYALARSLLVAPAQLLGKSVGDVFYQRSAQRIHDGAYLASDLRHATLSLAVLGAVPFGLIILLGPGLFAWAFGDVWRDAGYYAQWLALWLYCSLLNTPSVSAVAVLSLQRVHLLYEIVCVALRSAALLAGFHFFENDVAAVACLSVMGVFLNVLLIGAVFSAARRRDATLGG
ncbi:MAG: oligosaccharide flippase family protein [Pseudomonadota bacterium]